MKRFEELRDEFAPIYDGTTCSSAKVNAWKDGADWAHSKLKSEYDRLEAMCERLDAALECKCPTTRECFKSGESWCCPACQLDDDTGIREILSEYRAMKGEK